MKRDLTGKRFGRLTVLKEVEPIRNPQGKAQRVWLCKCDCGTVKSIRQYCLEKKTYATVSCGCYARETRRKTAIRTFTTHGHGKERLYAVWCGMKRRCEKEYDPEYQNYGGRGISVCEEWYDYEVFRKWAIENGYDFDKPRKMQSLDRIDNDGDYCPKNCRWATSKQQSQNTTRSRKFAWKGKEYTVTELMEASGTELSRSCLYKRLRKGYSVDEALSIPNMKNQYEAIRRKGQYEQYN